MQPDLSSGTGSISYYKVNPISPRRGRRLTEYLEASLHMGRTEMSWLGTMSLFVGFRTISKLLGLLVVAPQWRNTGILVVPEAHFSSSARGKVRRTEALKRSVYPPPLVKQTFSYPNIDRLLNSYQGRTDEGNVKQ